MAIAAVPDNSMRYSLIAYAAQRYGSEPESLWENQPSYAVLRHQASGRWYAVFMYVTRRALGLPALETEASKEPRDADRVDTVTVRCDARVRAFLLEEKGILPAYHMNQRDWVTILLDGTASIDRIRQLIDESFSLTAQSAADLRRQMQAASSDEGNDAYESVVIGHRPAQDAASAQRNDGVSVHDEGKSSLHPGADGAQGSLFGSAAIRRPESSDVGQSNSAPDSTPEYTDIRIPIDRERSERLHVPEKIRELQDMGRKLEREGRPTAYIFYQQGLFMADYTDDYQYRGQFRRYYPTYTVMTVDQLRGYFSFRTGIRSILDASAEVVDETQLEHDAPAVAESFLYLYVYELLNGIGVTAGEGYAYLRWLDQSYGRTFPSLHHDLSVWIPEYVIYYGLDRKLLADCGQQETIEQNNALSQLSEAIGDVPAFSLQEEVHLPEQMQTGLFFQAIQAVSSYDLSRSPLQKKHAEDLCRCVCLTIYGMAGIFRKQGEEGLIERYFGRKDIRHVRPFRTAVFYDHLQYEDYEYAVSGVEIWRCRQGDWTVESFGNGGRKSKPFGQLLREIDRQLREQLHDSHRLKPSGVDEGTTFLVQHFVQMYLHEKKEAARPKITIDMSLLAGIRRDAALTRDSLIVDEEDEDHSLADAADLENPLGGKNVAPGQQERPGSPTLPGQTESTVGEDHFPAGTAGGNDHITAQTAGADENPSASTGTFTPDEQFLVHALLYDRPYTDYLRQHHLMLSMLVDSINDKAMDEIGDTIIEFDGDAPRIIEDYREDLEEHFPVDK